MKVIKEKPLSGVSSPPPLLLCRSGRLNTLLHYSFSLYLFSKVKMNIVPCLLPLFFCLLFHLLPPFCICSCLLLPRFFFSSFSFSLFLPFFSLSFPIPHYLFSLLPSPPSSVSCLFLPSLLQYV